MHRTRQEDHRVSGSTIFFYALPVLVYFEDFARFYEVSLSVFFSKVKVFVLIIRNVQKNSLRVYYLPSLGYLFCVSFQGCTASLAMACWFCWWPLTPPTLPWDLSDTFYQWASFMEALPGLLEYLPVIQSSILVSPHCPCWVGVVVYHVPS